MENKSIYKELGLLGRVINIMASNLGNIIITLEAIALAYVVYNYQFTTNF